MIRLIALDIDDTLVVSGKPVSERNCKAIENAKRKGVRIVLATGRGYAGTASIRDQLQNEAPVINYGGSLVSDGRTGKPLYTHALSDEQIRTCFEIADRFGLHAQMYDGDTVITRSWNQFVAQYTNTLHLPYRIEPDLLQRKSLATPKVLLYAEPAVAEEMIRTVDALLPTPLQVLTSKPGFLEIGNREVSKASALRWVASYLGIDREEVAAIGDNTLDQSMIEWAGIGCCVGNGAENVKAVSDRVLPRCEDDGVVYFIETEVL